MSLILYKYVSFEGGCAILNDVTIGYTSPWDFNDPFEMGAGHGLLPNSALAPLALELLMERSAILSLTRCPVNPLMWAHYTQNHTGFVIGWDAHAAGFTDEATNLIPAQHGSVIYTETRPTHPRLGPSAPMNYGQEYAFRLELLETLQRLFLYKPMCWSYEEEVRVVKCVFGTDLEQIPSGPLRRTEFNNRPLYLATFPRKAIREIYLGVYNPFVTREKEPNLLQLWNDDARILKCDVSPDSWAMVTRELSCEQREE